MLLKSGDEANGAVDGSRGGDNAGISLAESEIDASVSVPPLVAFVSAFAVAACWQIIRKLC
jgi:hypothetical protein